jgi:hypothetical protein
MPYITINPTAARGQDAGPIDERAFVHRVNVLVYTIAPRTLTDATSE